MEIRYIQIITLAVVFGLQFLFEHIFPQQKTINDWKNERFNIAIGALNVLLTFIPASLFVQWLSFIHRHQLGLFNQSAVPSWLRFILTVIVMDCWMYSWHRLNHIVPFLWRFHSFHHKDNKMNSTTAVRFHIFELLMSYPGKALVCIAFGIGYAPLLVYEMLFFASIVIHHSNIAITERTDKIYRILFASPLLHRIHHSDRWAETNSNFGALFSFWDRLFSSWKGKAQNDIKFGVPRKASPEN
jgi:sterol desaturase/sphingolipid hydroxylase (fatty acid hydroxylase superfamily)